MTLRAVHRIHGVGAGAGAGAGSTGADSAAGPLNSHVTREGIAGYATEVRATEGLIESDAHVAIDDDTELVVTQLWQSEPAFSAHWESQLELHRDDALTRAVLAGTVDSEFYQLQRFSAVDGVWMTEQQRDRTPRIVWPARGALRLVLTMADGDIDGSLPRMLAEMASAALEPGCEEYRWYRSLENPRAGVVLERWQDQVAFDAHWHLRQTTMRPQPAPAPGTGLGPRALEFYRLQQFTHLYDRWFPAELRQRSETVVWPD